MKLRGLMAIGIVGLTLVLSSRAAEPVERPRHYLWSYTNRIQIHEVPVEMATPEADKIEAPDHRESTYKGIESSRPAPMQVVPPPQVRQPVEKEKKDDWLRWNKPDDKGTPEQEPTGWGWLADQIMNTNGSKEAAENEEAEDTENEGTSGALGIQGAQDGGKKTDKPGGAMGASMQPSIQGSYFDNMEKAASREGTKTDGGDQRGSASDVVNGRVNDRDNLQASPYDTGMETTTSVLSADSIWNTDRMWSRQDDSSSSFSRPLNEIAASIMPDPAAGRREDESSQPLQRGVFVADVGNRQGAIDDSSRSPFSDRMSSLPSSGLSSESQGSGALGSVGSFGARSEFPSLNTDALRTPEKESTYKPIEQPTLGGLGTEGPKRPPRILPW